MAMKLRSHLRCLVFLSCALLVFASSSAQAAGATTSVRLVRFAVDGTMLEEKMVSYQWMEENLKIYGDGKTHYYHQGPIFEGDPWDPDRIQNLKNKGAVKGSAIKDLCDLIGGMVEGDEVMFVGVDGWHMKFAASNINEPPKQQGIITLCWFNGRDGEEAERYGSGYPGNNAYSTAMQIVFLATETNADGKYVFGNSDMKIALPQEKYQYFFEGEFPSTNGLSGKWISEIRIYEDGVPEDLVIDKTVSDVPRSRASILVPVALGFVGVCLIGIYFYIRKKSL